jgi:glycosyltransferase involved in cell wall biosynthesis
MKIGLFDPYKGKFTSDMERWWIAHGHEVLTDPQGYYNPEIVDWADVVWFDTVSNNLISATNPAQALIDNWRKEQRKGEWDLHLMDMSKKKVIVRAIDIDVWSGHHASVKWDVVNECIFIAPHIREMMMADSRPQDSNMGVHTIPCGVDLNRWTFKERSKGFNIAVVSEIWVSKGVDYVLQIALKLKQIDSRYQIYWLGKWHDYHWEESYAKDFIEYNELPITFVDYVDDVNEWLEDKHYLLLGSKKEAFSYATAEAMAKGIKPVLHAFYGSRELWPGITWSSIQEAVDRITEDIYDSGSYRRYLQERGFTLEYMMERIMEVING